MTIRKLITPMDIHLLFHFKHTWKPSFVLHKFEIYLKEEFYLAYMFSQFVKVGPNSPWYCLCLPIPVAARSMAARLLGLRIQISPMAGMSVSFECCVLSSRCLCDGPITRPEEYYRLWCVLSAISEPRQRGGLGLLRLSSHGKRTCFSVTYEFIFPWHNSLAS
jgi:hypothetical protein